MMDPETRRRVRRRLRREGFDLTKSYKRGVVRVGCSQCNAMLINGLAIHEGGCPNDSLARRRRGRRHN